WDNGLWVEFPFPAEPKGVKAEGTTQETTQEQILRLLRIQPSITRKELAEKISLSSDGIKYHPIWSSSTAPQMKNAVVICSTGNTYNMPLQSFPLHQTGAKRHLIAPLTATLNRIPLNDLIPSKSAYLATPKRFG
ncbi:MAG: winged helix-turn-helix domain-containing protein, partial [bacterium]